MKKVLIIAAAAIFSVSAYAATAKSSASPGLHVLTAHGAKFTTSDPTGCPGVAFPASVGPASNPGTPTNPTAANQITIKQGAALPCTTRYTNVNGTYCMVTVKMKDGAAVVYAEGKTTVPHWGTPPTVVNTCKTINAKTSALILNVGS